MTLNADIQTRLAGAKAQMPPPVFAKLGEMFERLEAAHVGAGAPKVGEPAPDTRFTSRDGSEVSLASLHADGAVVLIFYRGRWCPFCDLTLRAFDADAEAFKSAGARLVGVSPQTTVESARTADERNLRFEVLRDPHNAAAQAFGLAWALTEEERALYTAFDSKLDVANGDDRWQLPAPATFIVDRTGVVRWAWVDSNWTRRPEPADVLAALHALQVRRRASMNIATVNHRPFRTLSAAAATLRKSSFGAARVRALHW